MKVKKTLALALLALGIVGVSACGSKEDNNKNDNTTDVGGDNPGGDNPGGNNPGGDNPGGDNPGGEVDPLKENKATAYTELAQYANDKYNAADESIKAEGLQKWNDGKGTLKAAIDAATTQDEIDAALAVGKAAIDKYFTKTIDENTVMEVKTAEDFLEMLAAETGTWNIKNDIDLTGTILVNKQNSGKKKFAGTINGEGHTITFNSNPVSVEKSGGLLYDSLFGATIRNITLKGINITGAGESVAIFGNSNKGATFENVVIDGAKGSFTKYSALLLAKAAGNIVLKNVAAINYDIQSGDYSGALVAFLGTATDADSTATDGINGNLKAEGILLDGTLNGGTQCIGGVVGFVNNSATDLKISIDGLVGKGLISGGKNIGLGVGSFKASGESLSVKNVLALDLEVKASTVLSPVSDTKVGITYGQTNITDKTKVVSENINAVKKATKVLAGSTDLVAEKATVVEVASIAAPTEAFTINNGKVALGNIASVDVPTVAANVDVAVGTISDGNTGDLAEGTASGTEITFAGTIGYYHKNGAAKFAGNGVEVKIDAAAGVDTTGATIKVGTGSAVDYVSGSKIYIPTTSLAETTTITVVWNDNANPQTYTVKYDAQASLAAAPQYGNITNADTTQGLVGAAENDTVTYTEGTIAWNADKGGNVVLVSVAKPDWVVDASAVKVTGGELQGTVAADAQSINVLAKVTNKGGSFSVQWTNDTDAKVYNVALAGATLEANPNAAATVTLDASELTPTTGDGYTTYHEVNETFTFLAGNDKSGAAKGIRVDGISDAGVGTQRINVSKGKVTKVSDHVINGIQINLDAARTARITVVACSSKTDGSSNSLALKDATLSKDVKAAVALVNYDVDGSTTNQVVFENVTGESAVIIGGVSAGIYVYSIIVEYVA